MTTSRFGGQEIEELGVEGFFALRAEVFVGFDDADAEELLPVAVDGDARGEGVIWRDEPAR